MIARELIANDELEKIDLKLIIITKGLM